jgi:hypothetical protein
MVSKEYRIILLGAGEEKLKEMVNEEGEREVTVARKEMKKRRRMRRARCGVLGICRRGLGRVGWMEEETGRDAP